MKIILLNATGSLSGAEQVLVRFAAKAIAKGDEVTLLCPSGPLVQAMPPGVYHKACMPMNLGGSRSITSVASYLVALISTFFALLRLSTSADRIVVNSTLSSPLAFVLGRRSVWLLHDVLGTDLRGRIGKLAAPFYKLVVPVSRAAADQISPRARVRVVLNGTPIPQVPRRRHASTEGLTIGCLAALTPWKGQKVLLEAIELLPEVEFRLELAGAPFPGDEQYAAELYGIATLSPRRDQIKFLGRVETVSTLARWDIMVLPSVSPEAMPLSILEALSMGVPCVATDIGGSLEILEEIGAELVPPQDAPSLASAITRLMASPERRQEQSDEGRKLVETKYRLAERTEELYSVLTAGSFTKSVR
jgi:glycosyltransferase involved in cell wall biosynthesis